MELSNLIVKPLYCYIDVKPFKYNDIYVITKLLTNNIRINEIFCGCFYGTTSFSSNKHDVWDVELFETYQKGKTNTIVVKLAEDEIRNPLGYKYLFIFQNLTNISNTYGYIWMKDSFKESLTKIGIEYLKDNIVQSINTDMNLWSTHKLRMAESGKPKKFNAIEIDEIYKEYIRTYRALSYEDWANSLKVYNARYKI